VAELSFADVHKAFGRTQAVRGVSLVCPEHHYLCLLGPSGCGKTTMLRMVAGLEQPDRGDILIGGERVNELEPGARNVGLAFQNYALYPHLTVAGNLVFPLRAPLRRRQYDRAEQARRVHETATLLRIEHLLDRPIGTLSGGQQQRVALGRALIRDPRALLLDEPITHLDARLRYEMRAEIKSLHRRLGTTTLHVTHDQQEAVAIADLIAVMREGRIEQVGPPLEVYRRPATAFVAGFIGDPPVSLLSARIELLRGGPALLIGGQLHGAPEHLYAALQAAPRRRVRVGLRPQHVGIVPADAADAIVAQVHAHEIVGRELQIFARIGEDMMRLRTDPGATVRAGDRIALRLSLEGAMLFEAESGAALRAG
jgi:ABC-type sugar transport system ATPase subunit